MSGKHKILIIDDSPGSIRTLAAVLDDDYDISITENGPKGLDLAASQPPDLILLDVVMPDMDGYEVCRRLKASPTTSDIPVIFVSAMNEVGDEMKGLKLGAVDYIVKPFSPAIVRARVGTHLTLKQARDELHGRNLDLEARVEKRTAELAKELEARKGKELAMRDYAETSADWFWEMDSDLCFSSYSANIAQYDLNPRDLIGKKRWELAIHDEDSEKWREHRVDLENHRPFRNFEYVLNRPGGMDMRVRVSGNPVFGKDGVFSGYRGTTTDVTERRRTEHLLRESEADLCSILDNMLDVFYRTDTDGRFTMLSPSIQTATGYHVSELMGNSVDDLYADPQSREQLLTQLQQNDGKVYDFQAELVHKDGRTIWASADVRARQDGDGQFQGVEGIVRDITHLKQLHEDLESARNGAEAANEAKSSFLASMSHEIRTPMNAVIGLSHLALKTDLSDKQRDYLSNIHASGSALMGIINDILDLSKVEANMMTLEETPFSLNAVIGQVQAVSGFAAGEKSLNLRLDVAANAPDALLGDALRLGQVLTNLVGNAVKFTEQGEVVLSVASVEQTAQSVSLRFSVRDTGIGLDKEHRNRLFQPFSQVDASTSRKYGGTGLGLAISRQLVELMGGEIGVESALGEGSTFHFTVRFDLVPAVPGTAPTPALEEGGDVIHAILGSRVLLVEDNDINQQIARELLEGDGLVVTIADNGRAALEALKQDAFDIVLMDIQMPEMDGYEATATIRADAHLSGLPVIAMTAHALAEERERCLAAGMDDHISKPIDPDALFDILVHWIRPGARRGGGKE